MLLFSTILEINPSMTKDAFIQLAIEWNQGSPHAGNVIPGIEWHGERNIRYGEEGLWLAIEEYRNQNIIAVRYEKREKDGVIWDTDYVMNFSSMKMAIRLDRSYTEEALTASRQFSAPYFITLLIERGYLKKDGILPVVHRPVILEDEDLEMLADVICGRMRCRLPVVYVSKTYYDEDPVNVRALASRLKGVAHVLVQKGNRQNSRLKELCSQKNEYYGAIGIYYPNQALEHRRYMARSSALRGTSDENASYPKGAGSDPLLLEKVVRSVIQYSNAQMIDTLYTWQGVNNALLRDRLASQREERLAAEEAQRAAEREAVKLLDTRDEEESRIRKQAMEEARCEADRILEVFEEDMQRFQKQIEELTRANEALQYENQGLKAKLDRVDSEPVLFMGNETEFYPGEIKDFVLNALSDALSRMQPKSRRADIVQDIIQNNDYQKQNDKLEEEIKRLLKNYNGMSGRLKQAFEDLGFTVTEDGKHCKIAYYGDGRYLAVFAKTPGDGRSGKNNASDLLKKIL